ncbi:MAG: ATP-binding protein [Bacteroidota bacterium]|nr:ATP-binding protein [Bacteroidota bacterium]
MIDRIKTNTIQNWLYKNKVVMIMGARQVGKTTICKDLLKNNLPSVYLNCERIQVKELLESKNIEQIRSFLGDNKLVVFDEAQKIKDIGLVLKLIHDTYPEIQIIASGSSSFELSNELNEPLTGRNIKFQISPISINELINHFGKMWMNDNLESLLRFGSYPDIVLRHESEKMMLLDEIATDYLYRDVLMMDSVKNSDLLIKLLKALALQLGNQVSYNELANLLKTSVETIQKYIRLLEHSFVIFKLGTFSRNLRSELAISQKYYFYDLGVRNSLLQNYLPMSNRTDVGALWENFCVIERMKILSEKDTKANHYFWRTYQQQEIDLVEERNGKLLAFEFKYSENAKVKAPKLFLETYKEGAFVVVNKSNFLDTLLKVDLV